MMKSNFVAISILAFTLFISCKGNGKNQITELVNNWTNKELLLPQNPIFVSLLDTINYSINDSRFKYKIISYTDASGCISCQLKLKEWDNFAKEVFSYSEDQITIVKFIAPHRAKDVFFELKSANYTYPVSIDTNDELNRLNKFPKDNLFRCFLLDENNKVILIGNPVQNPKIRNLYIRTICERLGVKTDLNVVSKPLNQNKSLGTFNWKAEQTATFTIHNTSNEPMLIDTLYSSCECTTAEIDKYSIEPADSAIVTITFKAEKPEMFMREVYIDVQGKEQIVLSIEGEAVE